MQGRHQSRGRRGVGLWAVIVPLAVLACDRSPAQEAPGGPRLPDRAPVALAADRIVTWDEGRVRWVRLLGRAAAFQGVDLLRAREAVVRIEPASSSVTGAPSYRVDVYAEGDARIDGSPEPPAPRRSWTVPATAEVQLRAPFSGRDVETLGEAPSGDPVLERGRAAFSAGQPGTVMAPPGAVAATQATPAPPIDVPLAPPADRGSVPSPAPSPAEARAVPEGDGLVRPVTLYQVGPEAEDGRPGPAEPRTPSVIEVPPPPPGPMDGSPFTAPSETQFEGDDAPLVPGLPEPSLPEIPLLPEIEPAPEGLDGDEPPVIAAPAPGGPAGAGDGSGTRLTPLAPGSGRVINIYPLNPGLSKFRRMARLDDGTETYVASGGFQIVIDDPERGTVDITARDAVIWTRSSRGGTLSEGSSTQSPDEPLEIYLEGDVELWQDRREAAGPEDRRHYTADRFYVDLKTERFYALNAELEQFAPGFQSPLRTLADSIVQYREPTPGPDGRPVLGLPAIRANNAITTGSPFARPGYQIRSSVVDLFKLAPDDRRGPLRRRLLNPVGGPSGEDVYFVDARNNTFSIGPLPFFYWPRFLTTTEDLNPPLSQISFRTNNLFGQMILSDWDGFKLLGLRQPEWADSWNIDIDYLSDRGFAAGSEFGYFGDDLSEDLFGRDLLPGISSNYFGYLDFWGINDRGKDNLGGGPAIITNGPPLTVAFRNSVPTFEDLRGRVLFRHMQSFLADGEDPLNDFKLQFEAAYISDRYFLEQYFKRLSDSGLDQRTRIYGIRQWRNRAVTATTEAQLQDWFTQSQWYPKLDYYRLGDAPGFLGRYFTYYQHSGASYANTHTAVEVNDPGIFFGFLPFDPTSLTSGPFRTGRLYTNHELDLPLKLRALRVIPYVQGQLMGWDNQYTQALPTLGFFPGLVSQDYVRGPQGSMIGRAWGAYGVRADVAFSRPFPTVESELFNVHGLMHKAVLYGDYRDAYSTLPLRRIGVQEELDDNTYEYVRRYFALNDYGIGVLPAQYNPLLLTLRRANSPITGTTDVQDRIETFRVGTSQRLQTKRGPVDDRRIIDFMSLDAWTYYYPDASRDNFGVPFGQTQYLYEWHLGDRTSIVSSGWFDYFDIVGDPRYQPQDNNGISIITAGVNISRPPRGTVYLAYSIIDTGPINTSALNTSFGYWLSPKWYSTFGGLYDFGEGMLLSTAFSVTRIGADFLTTVGINYTPLQDNWSFVFELVPRFSPRTRLGAAAGVPFRPDLRFAPIQ